MSHESGYFKAIRGVGGPMRRWDAGGVLVQSIEFDIYSEKALRDVRVWGQAQLRS